MKKISIIIPCYNAEKYIGRCLDSLTGQTIGFSDNVEVICLDDCSTDGSLDVLKKYERLYPENIIIIPLDENVGQGAARNIGIQYASGEYVNYVDADDYLTPGALKNLYRTARQNAADIVEYDFNIVRDPDAAVTDTRNGRKDFFIHVKDNADRKEFIMSGNILVACWNKFYRRDFILRHGLKYAEGVFGEESLFTVMAGMYCERYYKLQQRYYCYYMNPASTAHLLMSDMKRRDDYAKTWLELLLEMKERGLYERFYDEIGMNFVTNYLVRAVEYSVTRKLPMEPETLNLMEETVRTFFPDIDDNPYLRSMPHYVRALRYIGKPVPPEDFDAAIACLSMLEKD